jgi:hypothetical protein
MIMSALSRIAVPNALILISDLDGGVPPDVMRGSLIASTPSCIAVGCMSDSNGKTEVTLGATQEVGPRDDPAFVGELNTPNRTIAVWTVLRETILQAPVPHPSTRVRIWVNHPSEPDKVIIGLD